MFTLLSLLGETVLWCWLMMKHAADAVMGFAGYPETDEDETRIPTWVGWLVWFIAVAGLLGTPLLLALQG